MSWDLAVLGGGPAGMSAASAARAGGARVVVLDEHARPGGQVYRARAPGVAASAEGRKGDRLRAAFGASGAEWRGGQRVWGLGGGPLGVSPDLPFRIDTYDGAGVSVIEARALILCPGATERVIPFDGWTLPGVLGLAASTILLKAEGVRPGARVVVAGTGPLLAAVAAGVLARGGAVAAVVDARGRGDWLRTLPGLLRTPRLLGRGLGWTARVLAAGVPVLRGHRLVEAHGTEAVEAVTVAPLRGGDARRFACDAVCVGHGLVPATEAARLYGARMEYRDGWVPVLDRMQRTTVPRLYVAGDAAGIRGAADAPESGAAAAEAALEDLGLRPVRRKRVAGRGSAMAGLMTPPGALVDAIPPACVVCRCEDVTRREIDAAAALGARDLNQLKQFTRCGMGPCQGRVCGEAAAELLARHVGGRDAAGLWTARIPLRPVPMSALLGEFRYGDIPVPAPAPL